MKIYAAAASPNSRKVLAVAKHLGLNFDFVTVDLGKKEQRQPEYLALNPNGLVPTLVDGETKLWESNAIICYLAAKTDNTLWPRTNARYEILRWLFWETSHWTPAVGPIFVERVIKRLHGAGEPNLEKIKNAEERVQRYGEVLNHNLEGKSYLVDNTLTLADFALSAILTHWQSAQIKLDVFPHILVWQERMSEVPAWRDTLPNL